MSELKRFTDKTQARKHFKSVRDNTDKLLRRISDKAICEAVIKTKAFEDAQILMTYYPIGSEVDVTEVIERAWKCGKSVAFPRTVDRTMMDWHEAKSFRELHASHFGLMEPDSDPKTLVHASNGDVCLDAKTPALILVPGLAFDKQGYRLGYGGGYYDVFLSYLKSSAPSAISIGVARQNCIVEDLEKLGLKDAHDVAVNKLIKG